MRPAAETDRELLEHVLTGLAEHLGQINESLAATAVAIELLRDGKSVTPALDEASRGLAEATAHLGHLHGLTAAAAQSLLARATAERRLSQRRDVSGSTE